NDPQIRHAMARHSPAIYLKRAQSAEKTRVDLILAAVWQQHAGSEFPARQTTPQRPAHCIRMAAQGVATVSPAAAHRIEVLIPEQGEFPEPGQAALHQSADQGKIYHRIRMTDFAVLIKV